MLQRRFERLEARKSPDGQEAWLNWVMRLRDSGRHVGTLEATILQNNDANIAYMIFAPFQRRGFATEGCTRLVCHLIEDYRALIVSADIDTRNGASIALIERLGFNRVATHLAADVFKGEVSDEYRYELRAAK